MTTNLVSSLPASKCVGERENARGLGRGESVFQPSHWPSSFFRVTCYSFNSLSSAVVYNENESAIDKLNTFSPTQTLLYMLKRYLWSCYETIFRYYIADFYFYKDVSHSKNSPAVVGQNVVNLSLHSIKLARLQTPLRLTINDNI